MSTTSNPTKNQPGKLQFVVNRPRIVWQGKRRLQHAVLDVTPDEAADPILQGWIAHGWVSELRDGELVVIEPPKAAAAPAPRATPVLGDEENAFALLDPIAIAPSPLNRFRHFDQEAMDELVASVRESGVRQPIQVRPMPPGTWAAEPAPILGKGKWTIVNRHDPLMSARMPSEIMRAVFESQADAVAALPVYEIIAGERRWRAARLAGVTKIRAMIEQADEIQAAELRIIENAQREDLTDLEDAATYQYMLSLPGYDMARLVRSTGKSKGTIYGKIKLLTLPEPVLKAVEKGTLPPVTAELIARLEGPVQQQAVKEILSPNWQSEPLSFREAKERITELKGEHETRKLREKAERELETKGFVVLKGDEARKIVRYQDELERNCGYVGAHETCPRDPKGRKWGDVLKGQADATRLAVVVSTRAKGFVGLEIFERDFANGVLKKLGLWEAEGSEKAKEKEAARQKKLAAARATEKMNADLDAIVEAARSPSAAKLVLLAVVEVLLHSNYAKAHFVAERRELSHDVHSRSVSNLREAAHAMTMTELAGLVAELAAVTRGFEPANFREGIELVGRLLYVEDSAGARTEEEEAVAA